MVGFGTGIYSTREAAALLRERPTAVRRWAYGYERLRGGEPVRYPALIRTELPPVDGERALTFVELVELLYIAAFRRAGASWRTIREAAEVASRLFGSAHPFALRQLFVDAERILYGAVREVDGSESLVELRGDGQQAFPTILAPYLDQLEFGVDDVAARWWPLGRDGGIVVDPAIGFGAPRVEAAGIQAETLWTAYDAEEKVHGRGAAERVAWAYGVAPESVHTALRFRRWLRAA